MPAVIYDPAEIDFEKPGKHHYQVAFQLDGSWGSTLAPVTVINGARGANPNGVAVFGGTHGNEYEGQVAVKRLCQELDPAEMAGRVILIPQLSEGACRANRRDSPLDGVNMNRAFPGNPRGSVSYRIAHFVKTRVFPQVRVVLDLHSGGNEAIFALCSSFHPIADPQQRAEIATVARLFDTPFILIYSSQLHSGLLTDEAEAEGKVTIGGEFGHAEAVSRRGLRHAYEGVKNVLRHYGLLEGEVVKLRPAGSAPGRFVQAPALADYVPCPHDGVWEPAVDLGAAVRAGDLLGRLHDFEDHSAPAREIRAHRAGFVAAMYFRARVSRGVTLYVIAEEVPAESLLR